MKRVRVFPPWTRGWPIFSKHNLMIVGTLASIVLSVIFLSCFLWVSTSNSANQLGNELLITAAIAGLGGAITLGFSEWQRASVRVGIAETLASDVLSIGRVIIASGILHDITEPPKEKETKMPSIAEMPRERWEDYFSVYHGSLNDLRSFRSDVVIEITAFYALLKGSRDRIETLRAAKRRHLEVEQNYLSAPIDSKMHKSWAQTESQFNEFRKRLVADVLYILIVFAEHGRSCMESLLEEGEPLNEFGQNMFRLFELELICCLYKDKHPEGEDPKVLDKFRWHLIDQRYNDYCKNFFFKEDACRLDKKKDFDLFDKCFPNVCECFPNVCKSKFDESANQT